LHGADPVVPETGFHGAAVRFDASCTFMAELLKKEYDGEPVVSLDQYGNLVVLTDLLLSGNGCLQDTLSSLTLVGCTACHHTGNTLLVAAYGGSMDDTVALKAMREHMRALAARQIPLPPYVQLDIETPGIGHARVFVMEGTPSVLLAEYCARKSSVLVPEAHTVLRSGTLVPLPDHLTAHAMGDPGAGWSIFNCPDIAGCQGEPEDFMTRGMRWGLADRLRAHWESEDGSGSDEA
jgi:hypothetical protein